MKLRFIGKNDGKAALTRDQIKIMREFTIWVMKKFLSERILADIEIIVTLDGQLLRKEKMHGQSVWMDRPNRPREFEISVDTSSKFQNAMHTLSHELVHVKQWALGEFTQKMSNDVFVFLGEEVDDRIVDYWDQPWEIEAHGRGIGLVRQWIKISGRAKEKWARAKMTY